MVTQHHIVHKQFIEIDLNDSRKAEKVHDQAKRWYYDQVIPAIDQVLDEVCDNDKFIFIDDLNIDLGEIKLARDTQMIIELLQDQVRKALHDKIILLDDQLTPQQSAKEFLTSEQRSTNGVKWLGKEMATINSFFYYLEKGTMPIWYNFISVNQIEKEIMSSEKVMSGQMVYFKKLLMANPYIVTRLVQQFSTSFIQFIVGLLPVAKQDFNYPLAMALFDHVESLENQFSAVETVFIKIEILKELFHPSDKLPNYEQLLSTIQHRVTKGESQTWMKWIKDFYEHQINHNQSTALSLMHAIKQSIDHFENANSDNLPESIEPTSLTPHKDNQENVFLDSSKETQEDEGSDVSDLVQKVSKGSNEVTKHDIANHLVNDNDEVATGEFYYVENAGLVLFNPYLEMFFQEFDLVVDGSFVDHTKTEKATLLLQYLSNGKADVLEHELILNKLLCGLSVHDPVQTNIKLSDEEIAECENLLNAVIRNWTALKKTSIDGLREGFIQRPGKISKTADGWKLIVEQRSIDVLLSSIPWSFNVIKLPWLEQPIFVKWT